MPAMPPRKCTKPRCRNMATRKGRCDDHQHKAWDHSGLTAEQRGYGKQWRLTRKQALLRDDHLCQVCLANGIYTRANEVDHITNKASGGTDDINNLQSICTDCHKIKTTRERNQ